MGARRGLAAGLAYQQEYPIGTLGPSRTSGAGDPEHWGASLAPRRATRARRATGRLAGTSHITRTMELKLGLIADYAILGENDKLVVAGIFDTVWVAAGSRGAVMLPQCFVVLNLRGSLAEGTEHRVAVRLHNEDEVDVAGMDMGQVAFSPSGPGRPLAANLILQLRGVPVPRCGEYHFRVFVDEQPIGDVPIYVQQRAE
jgi:hypothetical protein